MLRNVTTTILVTSFAASLALAGCGDEVDSKNAGSPTTNSDTGDAGNANTGTSANTAPNNGTTSNNATTAPNGQTGPNLTEIGNYDIDAILDARGLEAPEGMPCAQESPYAAMLRVEFAYDSEGRLVHVDNYRRGTLGQRFVYRYDTEGRLAERVQVFNRDGTWELLAVYEHSYDAQGRPDSVVTYTNGSDGMKGDPLATRFREYASQDDWSTFFTGDPPTLTNTFAWNEATSTLTVERPESMEKTDYVFASNPPLQQLYRWDQRLLFQLDGELQSAEYENESSGATLTATRDYTYEGGRLVEVRETTDGGNVYTDTFLYDCADE